MIRLENILTPGRSLVNVPGGSKKKALEQIANLIAREVPDLEMQDVFEALIAREKLGSTGLGQGIAIPHGRIKGLKQAAGAFLRLSTPVPFDSPDGRPVGLLFVLLVPEQATEEHLQILSELAQRFADRSFREALLAASDSAAVVALFRT